MVAKTRIIRIGSSHGVRLPKAMLEQAGLRDEVELNASRHRIVIQAPRKARQGWEEQFRQAAAVGHDDLTFITDTPSLTRWDDDEWEW